MADLECYNTHILEEDFIKLFKPIHIGQALVGTIRMKIKYRFVSKCSQMQKAYSLLLIPLTTFFCIQEVITSMNIKENQGNRKIYMENGLLIVSTVTYAITVINNKYFNCTKNAELYLSMQKIDRILKLTINGQFNRRNYRSNVAGCIFIWITYIIPLIYTIFTSNLNLYILIAFMTQVISGAGLELEMMNMISILYYLVLRLKSINKIISHINSDECVCETKLLHIVKQNNDNLQIDVRALVKAFKEIIETYSLFKNNFKFSVSVI